MLRLAVLLLAVVLASCAGQLPPLDQDTRVAVYLFDGLGGAPTSPGVAQIAAQLAALPGVQVRGEFLYDGGETAVQADIHALPSSVKAVIFGYSCGVQSTATVANAVAPRPIYLAAIQGSVYCAPAPLGANVVAAQETYNANCIATGGLGCAAYQAGPELPAGRITLIERPDSHGEADIDPDAQRDVVRFVQAALGARLKAVPRGDRVRIIVRHRGE